MLAIFTDIAPQNGGLRLAGARIWESAKAHSTISRFTASGGTAFGRQFETLAYKPGWICKAVAKFRVGNNPDATRNRGSSVRVSEPV